MNRIFRLAGALLIAVSAVAGLRAVIGDVQARGLAGTTAPVALANAYSPTMTFGP